MLDDVLGQRLRRVERFAWQSDDGSPMTPNVGSVHLWFEGGRCVHLDGASDWSLKWAISQSGDDRWMTQYLYEFHGKWVLRESTTEEPFAPLIGSALTSATPVFNEMNEVVGVSLQFEDQVLILVTRAGEIDTSAR